MNFKSSERLTKLPPYLFSKIDQIKKKELEKGRSLISLSIGDPDLPTPQFIIDRLIREAQVPSNHQYPSYAGMKEFREAVSRWYERRFQVSLDPKSEVLTLVGSKEGIAHIPLAFLNPGDAALVPDPGYPVYSSGTILADGQPISFSLTADRNYLPDFNELENKIRSYKNGQVRLLFLNYPNNPTAACASVEFFEEVAQFAKKMDLIVCHDNAYSEIYFDKKPQPSFLQAPTAKEVGCEFHSLSKTFNMTGWRVGFVAGNASVIEKLGQVKTNVDSGAFNACQLAGVEALDHGDSFCEELRQIYQTRRDVMVQALREVGLECHNPEATFYVWTKVPGGKSSEDYVMDLILNSGIVTTPGNGFGACGEGFIRFTLCSEVSVLKQVAQSLKASV